MKFQDVFNRCGLENEYVSSCKSRILDNCTKFLDDKKEEHWKWNGFLDIHGYPRISFRGHTFAGHRVSYFLFNDDCKILNFEDKVLHKCKEKNCLNPEHLEMGSHDDNMNDKKRDGTNREGENHPMAKLKNEVVKKIKLSKGQLTPQERANQFNVSVDTIHRIDRGDAWKCIQIDNVLDLNKTGDEIV